VKQRLSRSRTSGRSEWLCVAFHHGKISSEPLEERSNWIDPPSGVRSQPARCRLSRGEEGLLGARIRIGILHVAHLLEDWCPRVQHCDHGAGRLDRLDAIR
jgi:hypothetical protein